MGLEGKQKKDFEIILRNNTQLVTRLLKILSDKEDLIERLGAKEEDYTQPELLARMAFRNGKLAALKEIADLFNYY